MKITLKGVVLSEKFLKWLSSEDEKTLNHHKLNDKIIEIVKDISGDTIIPLESVIYRLLKIIKTTHKPFTEAIRTKTLEKWISEHILFAGNDSDSPIIQQEEQIADTEIGE